MTIYSQFLKNVSYILIEKSVLYMLTLSVYNLKNPLSLS